MTKNKILVVDDTQMYQTIYKTKLMSEGFEVKIAGNGAEAIRVLSGEAFDLVLLDLTMPLMDGFKVLQAIKENPKLSSTPVVVFSSRGQPQEIEKAVNLGANGYLVKSTTPPNEVVKKVKELLGGTYKP